MSTEQKKSIKQSLVVSEDNTDTKAMTTEHTSASSNSSTTSSAQKQLLVLAKQFVLDGALIADSKQMPLEDRALRRDRIYLLRKQQNLEAIIQKSLAYCPSSSSSTKADPDWFSQFTVLAEDVSNNTMQDLWAKILAGEIAQPGSFSLKSLSIFKAMSITDAKLLAKVCSVVVKDSSKKNTRILSGSYQTPGFWSFFTKNPLSKVNLNQCDVSYTELLSLAENNIIFMQEAESKELNVGEKITFNFNGKSMTLTAKKKQCVLNFYKFTPVGSELALLISDNPHKDFIPLLKASLKQHFSISES